MSSYEVNLSKMERFIRARIQHYSENKYWSRREKVISSRGGGGLSKCLNYARLLYIKRCDAFNNASTGTHLGFGAQFQTPPKLPHGLYGIIISHNAVIGSNCTIFHQVAIGEGKGGAPIIGDNVLIGAGAKIIGNIRIGSNSRIGANAVVISDVPANSVVVAPEGNVLEK